MCSVTCTGASRDWARRSSGATVDVAALRCRRADRRSTARNRCGSPSPGPGLPSCGLSTGVVARSVMTRGGRPITSWSGGRSAGRARHERGRRERGRPWARPVLPLARGGRWSRRRTAAWGSGIRAHGHQRAYATRAYVIGLAACRAVRPGRDGDGRRGPPSVAGAVVIGVTATHATGRAGVWTGEPVWFRQPRISPKSLAGIPVPDPPGRLSASSAGGVLPRSRSGGPIVAEYPVRPLIAVGGERAAPGCRT